MTSVNAKSAAWRWLVSLGVGAVCVWLSFRGLDPVQVGAALGQAQPVWIGVAVLLVVTVALVKGLRWWFLFPRQRRTGSWWRTFSVLMTAQMLNVLVPIRLGELARLGLMLQEGAPVGATLSTIVVEKSLDLLAAGVLVAVAVSGLALPAWFPASSGVAMGVAGATVLAALMGVWLAHTWIERIAARVIGFRNWLPARVQAWLLRFVRTMLEGLSTLARGKGVAPILGLTIVSWIASIATMVAMFQAFGLPLTWQVAFVLSLTIYFSNLIPAPPALVGVVSAVSVMTLTWFAVPRVDALALGVVLNVVLVGPLVLMGGWATWLRFSALTGGALRERWVWSLGLGRERE